MHKNITTNPSLIVYLTQGILICVHKSRFYEKHKTI